MRHVWSVVCRYAVEDKSSNNFSLIDAVSQLAFKGEIPPDRPVNLPFSYHIVSMWRRKNDEDRCNFHVRMRIISPDNAELTSAELTVRLSEHDHWKTNFRSDSFQYTENGIYEFEISYLQDEKWIVASQVPLKVTHRQPEPESQDSEPIE